MGCWASRGTFERRAAVRKPVAALPLLPKCLVVACRPVVAQPLHQHRVEGDTGPFRLPPCTAARVLLNPWPCPTPTLPSSYRLSVPTVLCSCLDDCTIAQVLVLHWFRATVTA